MGVRPVTCLDCGFESRRGHGSLSLVRVVCYQVEVSATDWSLVQRSPTECVMSTCDREPSTMRRALAHWGGCCIIKQIYSEKNNIWQTALHICGPGSVVGIATDYGLDGPGIESRWGRDFIPGPNQPWGPPNLLYNGYHFFPGGKKPPGRDADPSPLLVSWSWKGRAIPLLPLWAVRPVQSLSACTRGHFTLPLTYTGWHKKKGNFRETQQKLNKSKKK